MSILRSIKGSKNICSNFYHAMIDLSAFRAGNLEQVFDNARECG